MTLSGPKRRLLRLLACVPAAAAAMANPAAAQDGCTLTAIGTAAVVAIRDGRTLLLEDGREVRLAGIEVTAGSRDMVRRLAGGKTLRLAGLGAETDRYGRLVAFAFPAGARKSLQHSLLAAGQARVSARIGDKACADSLLATERAARAAGRGHWALGADPNFAP
ncbi:MAG: thermonuclease family protein, partial [Pseudolabrys sp.]|nr:thermonuclease family protein [Pseudolabrys sp.]